MQERGVSKRVAVRFDQVGADGKLSAEAVKAAEFEPQATDDEPATPPPAAEFEPLEEADEEPELVTVGAELQRMPQEQERGNGDGNGHEPAAAAPSAGDNGQERGNGDSGGFSPLQSMRQRLAAMLEGRKPESVEVNK